jgi:integrase
MRNRNGAGKARRTLSDIKRYPSPREILASIRTSPGWSYKDNMEYYMKRDRALVCTIYLLALRISEALRLTKNQFRRETDKIIVGGIKLSKPRKKGKPRKHEYREGWLPLEGPRAEFTTYITDYLQLLEENDRLFPFGRGRAWQIVTALTGQPCHFERAYGEDYLYEEWDHDILAVADYVKVEPRTLQEYIRKRYERYSAA